MLFFFDIKEFSPGAKKFLGFSAINLISWQCIVGQFLVLFGRYIGMPASWVGMLVSFMPLSMFLVIFSVPIVEQYGSKRVMMVTWMLRNLAAIPVLLIPWFSSLLGKHSSWYILMLSTLGFSLSRAIGVGAWYPWIHELVPKKIMGKYLSLESSIMQTLNVLVIFIIANVLGMEAYPNRFYYVYSIGIVAGIISSFYILSIQGGESTPLMDSGNGRFTAILSVWKEVKYRKFILLSILSLSSVYWLNVSSILYLRDVLNQSDASIMVYLAIGAIGVAISIRLISRGSENLKGQVVLTIMLICQSVIAFIWFGLNSFSLNNKVIVGLLVAIGTIAAAAITIFSSQQMLGLVKQKNKVGYTSVWVIGSSVSFGIPPIFAGWFINHLGLIGYQLCFFISGCSALLVAIFWYRFELDDSGVLSDLQPHVRHFQPLRSMQRIVWMVLSIRRKE